MNKEETVNLKLGDLVRTKYGRDGEVRSTAIYRNSMWRSSEIFIIDSFERFFPEDLTFVSTAVERTQPAKKEYKAGTETAIQMQYAARQFEIAKVRAMMHHASSILATAKGDFEEAARCTRVMNNHIHTMDETNDFIDSCVREEACREYASSQG